ncbi:hypothetical protein GOBAR_AA08382 [Gossypium barbadense]|uniref:ARID domain-containing protein n=1 Tax=Gossypium barbadense TaxID=3634 RepID=A0A2P5Y9I6_GOSBA|nr:hypothetical protein GOBAR_AA08382 [Gossypium barbadense]
MAGWSMRADGSSLDCAKTLEKLEPALVDLDPFSEGLFLKSEPDKIRFWFNKFLGLFLKEVCAQGCYRPLPPLLADGQPVDLFKLFLVVSENGGYNAVSKSGLWDLVAKESGFDLNVASSLNGHLMELGAELKGFLLESKKKVMEYSQVEESIVAGSDRGDKCVKGEESMRIDLTKRVLRYEEVENLQNDDDLKSTLVENLQNDDDLKSTLVENLQNDDDLKSTVVDSECEKRFILIDVDDMPSDMAKSATNSMCNEDEDCRKRDSTWEMLNWVNEVAKDPCALVVGSLPESSKWTAYGSEELWKQVLLFREAAFGRKDDSSSAGQSNLQKNQKMHPFMYDDDNGKFGYNLRERLSCTRKVFFGKMTSKGQDRSQPSSSGNHSDLDGSTIGISKHLHGTCDTATPGSVFDYDVDIQVPIGPLFQVEVPEWTGVVSESDSKWLGTRVWPLEKKENRTFIELDRIGKGRPDSCGCHIQNSIQCVRFHVSQKRMKIKLELGSAFNKWNFDQMGEYVAIAWGEEEKSMFSSIIKSNSPSLDKSFWDEIYKYFRNKSREELVCYYYNAFLLQRRANQNRTTPSNINSDDEEPEEESESVSKGSKREAIKPYTSILISPKKSHKRTRYSS